MGTKLDQLRKRLRTIYCLREASALLSWDQETCLPRGRRRTRRAAQPVRRPRPLRGREATMGSRPGGQGSG